MSQGSCGQSVLCSVAESCGRPCDSSCAVHTKPFASSLSPSVVDEPVRQPSDNW